MFQGAGEQIVRLRESNYIGIAKLQEAEEVDPGLTDLVSLALAPVEDVFQSDCEAPATEQL